MLSYLSFTEIGSNRAPNFFTSLIISINILNHYYLILKVASEKRAKSIPTIQNLTTILLSCIPANS